MDPQQFDYDDDEPQQFLICYRGNRYILTEADAGTAVAFRNTSLKMASVQFGSDRSPTGARMEGGAEAELVLLAGCVCKTAPDKTAPPHLTDRDGKGWKVLTDRNGPVRVTQAELKTWGSKITKPLFEKAKEISDLGEKVPDKSEGPTGNIQTNHDDLTIGSEDYLKDEFKTPPEAANGDRWEPPTVPDVAPKAPGRSTTSSA